VIYNLSCGSVADLPCHGLERGLECGAVIGVVRQQPERRADQRVGFLQIGRGMLDALVQRDFARAGNQQTEGDG
jgi:hypothetical protein